MQGWRQVGIQAHVNPHSAQAEQDDHLDEALSEVFLYVKHGIMAYEEVSSVPSFTLVNTTANVSAEVSLGKV